MADVGRVVAAPQTRPWLTPVVLLRAVLILAALSIWQLLSISGLFYHDVVPSLSQIAAALVKLLAGGDFYWNLWVTLDEIAFALVIGGVAGLVVGLIIGGNKFIAQAFEPYLYYLGPTPKIIFFPVMIMWFGVDAGPKIAMGAVSCFFPIALNVAAGMRQIDAVLIKVGESFRANAWQMVALIGTLLAETKLSNRGIGYLVISAYNAFDMPQLYAILIVLFVLAIGANVLVTYFGGLDEIRQK
jgi:NitT/TauT family transport system permease protein